jgi:TolB-like protein/Tfp pilus assembly protein PilF
MLQMAPGFGRIGFGAFSLDLETGELSKAGRNLKLQPQPARVLCLLAGRAGKLVSREEIRRGVWGESTFVDYDFGVDYSVNRIRAVLCDRARAPRYIETVPRKGYRFIAPVKRERAFAEPTLAVLPFANLNGDPAKDYFADGVTDAMITELARIPSLRVISRQSVLHLKGSSRKLTEIARDLDVDGVVEGSALHEGDRVRITAQLILLDPERHVWGQSYDADMGSVLATQREAAQSVAASVASALSDSPAAPPFAVAPAAPVPPEIIEMYLKARSELARMSAAGIGAALQYFRAITTNAPFFAPGLAEHSLTLAMLGFWGHAPIRETYPAAKVMAQGALAIDERVEAAHVALGLMHWLLDWDAAAAEGEFRRAIELSPSNADARSLYSMFLAIGRGQPERAVAEMRCAMENNPASPLASLTSGWVYLFARKYRLAEEHAGRTLELFPEALHGHLALAWAQWYQGRRDEAVARFEQAVLVSREPFSMASLAHTYALAGQGEKAMGILHELEGLFAMGNAPAFTVAVVYCGLGKPDAALDWLETMHRLRDSQLFWLNASPWIDPIRPDPRFGQFMRSAGLAAS